MSGVKWVKITTDMFNNRKIKYLRRLPDGNNIVLIWVMLLTMAGRCNSNGLVFLTENIPYTPKMLADELEFEENTVLLALNALEQLHMIVTDENGFAIAGWDEYQNIEGLEKIREQTRKRVAKHREIKQLEQRNVTCNVTVTHGNALEEDIEEDKEKESIRAKRKRFSPPSLDEVAEYVKEKGYHVDPQGFIDHYTANGWKVGRSSMVDWKAAVRNWERRDNPKASKPDPNKGKRTYCPHCGKTAWKNTQTGGYFCDSCRSTITKAEVVWK